MKLRYSATSPYVRKVVVLAREAGLFDQLTLVPTTVSPVTVNDEISAENPLAKVPTLVLDSGEALFDSRVIAEYLDSLHQGTPFFPAVGPARWAALRQQAIADGLLEASLLIRYEIGLRHDQIRSIEWVRGQTRKQLQAVGALEKEAASLSSTISIGSIAVACALGYLDFRFPEIDWRANYPELAIFYAEFAARPSMVATVPA